MLLVIYGSTSVGATIHMHYCMGKLADWGLERKDSKTCPKCGMDKSETKDNGCCKYKHTLLKSTIDQKVTESAFQVIQLMAAALPVSFIEIISHDFLSVTEENPISHAPPRSSRVAVYVRNCVFLI